MDKLFILLTRSLTGAGAGVGACTGGKYTCWVGNCTCTVGTCGAGNCIWGAGTGATFLFAK